LREGQIQIIVWPKSVWQLIQRDILRANGPRVCKLEDVRMSSRKKNPMANGNSCISPTDC
jgi:hypothetical protein